jgi:hypothetical protein
VQGELKADAFKVASGRIGGKYIFLMTAGIGWLTLAPCLKNSIKISRLLTVFFL